MEQFIGCFRGVTGDLNLVCDFVPHFAISPFFLRDATRRNSAKIGRDFNEFCHTSCLRLFTSQFRCGDLRLENGLTVIFVLWRSFIVRIAARQNANCNGLERALGNQSRPVIGQAYGLLFLHYTTLLPLKVSFNLGCIVLLDRRILNLFHEPLHFRNPVKSGMGIPAFPGIIMLRINELFFDLEAVVLPGGPCTDLDCCGCWRSGCETLHQGTPNNGSPAVGHQLPVLAHVPNSILPIWALYDFYVILLNRVCDCVDKVSILTEPAHHDHGLDIFL